MALGHVGAHDHDAVGVRHVARKHRRRPLAQSRDEPPNAGAMADARLMLDQDDAEAATEFLRDVIELVVERRAAKVKDRRRGVHALSVGKLLDEPLVAHRAHQLGHTIHRPLDVDLLLVHRAGLPMQYLREPVDVFVELIARGALQTERTLVVRTTWIAFDVDDLA